LAASSQSTFRQSPWLAQNYDSAEAVISVGAFVVIMGLTVALVWVNRLAYKRIEQLEEL